MKFSKLVSFKIMWKNIEIVDVQIIDLMHIKCTYYPVVEMARYIPYELRDKNTNINVIKDYLETRCVPRTRVNIDKLLNSNGLDYYDPYEIVRISHGVQWEDYVWIKFEDESLVWEDVKIRD